MVRKEDQGVPAPSSPSGCQPSASAVPASQSGIPNAMIAPLPEPKRVSAIARIATANLDGLVGPPAWSAAEVAARHGYGYGWYAALPAALEYAAALAELEARARQGHEGAAAKAGRKAEARDFQSMAIAGFQIAASIRAAAAALPSSEA